MKFLVPFVCCLAFACALPGGRSVSESSLDDHGNYAMAYAIIDAHGAENGREEKGDAKGNKVGSYTIKDIDGRSRRVEYVADEHGFRVVIKTNEPGTATSALADAKILSSAPVVTDAKLVAAPAQLSYAAPIAYAPAPILKQQRVVLTKSYEQPSILAADPWEKAW